MLIGTKQKFDFFKNDYPEYSSFDFSWLLKFFNNFPICMMNFKIKAGKNNSLLICWDSEEYSCILKVNLIEKTGYYSEYNLKKDDKFSMANLDLSLEKSWINIVEKICTKVF